MGKVAILENDWLVFRTPEPVTNRQRRPFRRASARLGELSKTVDGTAGEGASAVLTADPDFAEEFMSALAFMIIADWSFDVPVFTDWDLFRAWIDDAPALTVDAVLAAAWAHHIEDIPEPQEVPPKNVTPKKPKAMG